MASKPRLAIPCVVESLEPRINRSIAAADTRFDSFSELSLSSKGKLTVHADGGSQHVTIQVLDRQAAQSEAMKNFVPGAPVLPAEATIINYSRGEKRFVETTYAKETSLAQIDEHMTVYGEATAADAEFVLVQDRAGLNFLVARTFVKSISVDLGNGNDHLVLSDIGCRTVVVGARGDDTLISFQGDTTLSGGRGDDFLWIDDRKAGVLVGGRGDDYFYAIRAQHTIQGGAGKDEMGGIRTEAALDVEDDRVYRFY